MKIGVHRYVRVIADTGEHMSGMWSWDLFDADDVVRLSFRRRGDREVTIWTMPRELIAEGVAALWHDPVKRDGFLLWTVPTLGTAQPFLQIEHDRTCVGVLAGQTAQWLAEVEAEMPNRGDVSDRLSAELDRYLVELLRGAS